MHFGYHHKKHAMGCTPRRGRFGHGRPDMRWGMEEKSGRGRRARMFDGGELRLVLLKLIADEPRHGYDLIKGIEDLTGGGYAPSPGVVYPTLTMLTDMDFITEEAADGARKRFAVTEAGTAHLAENAELVDVLMARLSGLGEDRKRTDARSVRRAMGNLRQVLINRLSEAEDEAFVHRIVEAIDEAARKIEQLK